jgi:hypothetical protein
VHPLAQGREPPLRPSATPWSDMMADKSGAIGLLGVIIGVLLVLGLVYFLLSDVHIKVEIPAATPIPK